MYSENDGKEWNGDGKEWNGETKGHHVWWWGMKAFGKSARIALRKKIEGVFSVKIIQNMKKSVIVKLLFNDICITVSDGFTV